MIVNIAYTASSQDEGGFVPSNQFVFCIASALKEFDWVISLIIYVVLRICRLKVK